MCRDVTDYHPKYKKADKSVLALLPLTSNASNKRSGLVKGEGSSGSKSRGIIFLTDPCRKEGEPQAGTVSQQRTSPSQHLRAGLCTSLVLAQPWHRAPRWLPMPGHGHECVFTCGWKIYTSKWEMQIKGCQY